MNAGIWSRNRMAATVVVVLLAAAPAACKQAEAAEAEHYQPSKITPAKEKDGHPTVTLTRLGAEQIGLETEAVRDRSLPYAAMLYGADGQPYVFVSVEDLTFHRADITVKGIAGHTVSLTDGPPDGTQVVTVGLPQIHGAELEFGAY